MSGTAVLRFDYFGTGDSPGDDTDGEFEGWRRDVNTAHEELRRRVGERNILWIGARLGATLAVLAAKSGRCDPSGWCSGTRSSTARATCTALRAGHVEALEHSYCIPDPDWRRQLAPQSGRLHGGPVRLRRRAGAAPATALARRADPATDRAARHASCSRIPKTSRPRQWGQAQAARQMPVTVSPFRHPLIWTSDPHPNNAMVPPEALQRLIAQVHE